MTTVLFVDDDPAILVTLPRMLRREPYQIVVAASAAQALEILQRRTIDVVVSDQQMPGMRGTELLTRVRQLHPRTARIILTGEPGRSAPQDLGCEVHRVLRKPATAGEITAAIADALQMIASAG
jgi:DNA-binding NtrC family response regulator